MSETRRRALGLGGAAIGAVGFVVALAIAYTGMREVMVEAGGFCARGGPFEIAQECSDSQLGLLFGGLAGLLVCGLLVVSCTAWAGYGVLGSSLVLWAALFGTLGWNFVDLGLDPPGSRDTAWGWIVSGALFWPMALGGLIPAVLMAVGRLRRGNDAEAPLFREPLVRAAVQPAAPPTEAVDAPPLPSRLTIPPADDPTR